MCWVAFDMPVIRWFLRGSKTEETAIKASPDSSSSSNTPSE